MLLVLEIGNPQVLIAGVWGICTYSLLMGIKLDSL